MASDPHSSDHFRRGRFFNPDAPGQRFTQFLKWISHRKVGYWPKFVPGEPGPKPLDRILGRDLVVTFVNHSTFLIQTGGCNILTDPVWSDRVSPIPFLGPRRHRSPGIRFEDLPPIDCVLISHNHYDHLDVPTLRKLARRDCPRVFCPLGVRGLLLSTGLTQVYELDWYDSYPWKGLVMHCVPAQHFSSRTPFDRDRTLWCGWVLEANGSFTYFAGDTGFGKHLADIAARFHPIQLALLPIGAYEPEWFMGPVHMTPEQAVDAQQILQASVAIATHFGTFSLADDSMAAPTDRLKAALRNRIPQPAFLVLAEREICHLANGSVSTGKQSPSSGG